jgi:hypothetical protein
MVPARLLANPVLTGSLRARQAFPALIPSKPEKLEWSGSDVRSPADRDLAMRTLELDN